MIVHLPIPAPSPDLLAFIEMLDKTNREIRELTGVREITATEIRRRFENRQVPNSP